MGALILLQAATFFMVWRAGESLLVAGGLTPQEPALPPSGVSRAQEVFASPSASEFDAALPWIALAWSSVVCVLALRAGWQWLGLRRLVQSARASPMWQRRLDSLAIQFGVSGRVKILSSAAVGSPVLIGVVRPVILLPVALMCGMTISQVELILAHELAHVRRLDPLFNALQVIVETLYFHHPLVRWVSREVRQEREICSDAVVLSQFPACRRDYIGALATLGESQRAHSLILASNGGLLLERVQLIASRYPPDAGRGSPVRFVAVILGVVLAICMAPRESSFGPAADAWLTVSMPHTRMTVAGLALPQVGPFGDLAPRRVAAANALVSASGASLPAIPVDTASGHLRLHDLGITGAAPAPVDLASLEAPVAAGTPVLTDALLSLPGPMPVRIQQPSYPRQALEAGIEGAVVIEFGIGRGGIVRESRIVRSTPEGVFDQAALAALQDSRFAEPTTSDAALRYRQTITFTLHGEITRRGDRRMAKASGSCVVVTGTHICRVRASQGSLPPF
jgi:TonB family protein